MVNVLDVVLAGQDYLRESHFGRVAFEIRNASRHNNINVDDVADSK